jgi:peptidoglycan/LPS O-acetylase OafA/YrhL
LIVLWLPPAVLPRFLIAMLVISPSGRIISYQAGDDFGYYVLMPFRADILAVGALIAFLKFSGPASDLVRRSAKAILIATVCAFPMFVFLIGGNTDFHMALWGHTYLMALFGSAVFMVLQNRGSPSLALLISRAAEFFARISYALYLIHINVLIFVFLVFRTDRTIETWKGAILTAVALAISVLICFISYVSFEGHLIRMAHQKFRFEGASRTAAESRPAAA